MLPALSAANGLVTDRFGEGGYKPRDSFATPSAMGKAADATVLLLPRADLLDDEGTRVVATPTQLCPGNAVAPATRPRVAPPTCSAAMISSRRIITAAHCLNVGGWVKPSNHLAVEQIKVLRGYSTALVADDDFVAPLEKDSVRSVEKVLYCTQNLQTDIAVLELSSPLPAQPMKRSALAPQLGEAAHLLSYPLGLPLVISTCFGANNCVQATVTEIAPTMFRSPLDSFHGSSGGSVINDNGELIGIFRGGAPQDVADSSRCFTDIVHPDSCAGDLVSRIDSLSDELFDDTKKDLVDVACEFGPEPSWDPKCPTPVQSAPGHKPISGVNAE